MDIYEEIVDLLGLNNEPESLDDIEDKLLQELNELNENYRTIKRQIQDIEKLLGELRRETADHNQRAISAIKKGLEDKARMELEQKEEKMQQVREKEDKLGNLRRHLDKIEQRRQQLEDKLQEIREQKKY